MTRDLAALLLAFAGLAYAGHPTVGAAQNAALTIRPGYPAPGNCSQILHAALLAEPDANGSGAYGYVGLDSSKPHYRYLDRSGKMRAVGHAVALLVDGRKREQYLLNGKGGFGGCPSSGNPLLPDPPCARKTRQTLTNGRDAAQVAAEVMEHFNRVGSPMDYWEHATAYIGEVGNPMTPGLGWDCYIRGLNARHAHDSMNVQRPAEWQRRSDDAAAECEALRERSGLTLAEWHAPVPLDVLKTFRRDFPGAEAE